MKSSGETERTSTFALAKNCPHHHADIHHIDPPQSGFKIVYDTRRRDKKIPGNQHLAHGIVGRAFKSQIGPYGAAGTGMFTALNAGNFARLINFIDEFLGTDFFATELLSLQALGIGEAGRSNFESETITKCRANACCIKPSPGVDSPSNSRRVTTRWAAESSFRFSSLDRGTRSAHSMTCGSMSTSTVPWKNSVSPSKKPPVPLILRPSTSISLRGR